MVVLMVDFFDALAVPEHLVYSFLVLEALSYESHAFVMTGHTHNRLYLSYFGSMHLPISIGQSCNTIQKTY